MHDTPTEQLETEQLTSVANSITGLLCWTEDIGREYIEAGVPATQWTQVASSLRCRESSLSDC